MADLETPPTSADLSDDDKLAMALIALATTGVGGLVGGRTGAMSGAVAGGKGAGMVAQDKADKEKKAEELQITAKAKEASRQQNLTDQKGLIDYKDELERKKPKDPELRQVDGTLLEVKDGTAKPLYTAPAKPEKGDDFKDTEIGKAAQSEGNKLTDDSRPYREALDAAGEAEELLKLAKTNPAAAAPGLRKLARASGEKGVLSDSDAKAFNGSPAIMDRLMRMAEAAAKGTLPDEDVKFALEITNKMRANSQKQFDTMQTGVVKRFAKNFKISEDEAYERLTGTKRSDLPPKTVNIINAKTGEKLTIPESDLAAAREDGFEVEK